MASCIREAMNAENGNLANLANGGQGVLGAGLGKNSDGTGVPIGVISGLTGWAECFLGGLGSGLCSVWEVRLRIRKTTNGGFC